MWVRIASLSRKEVWAWARAKAWYATARRARVLTILARVISVRRLRRFVARHYRWFRRITALKHWRRMAGYGAEFDRDVLDATTLILLRRLKKGWGVWVDGHAERLHCDILEVEAAAHRERLVVHGTMRTWQTVIEVNMAMTATVVAIGNRFDPNLM